MFFFLVLLHKVTVTTRKLQIKKHLCRPVNKVSAVRAAAPGGVPEDVFKPKRKKHRIKVRSPYSLLKHPVFENERQVGSPQKGYPSPPEFNSE